MLIKLGKKNSSPSVITYSNSGNNLFRIAYGNGIYIRAGQYGIEYSYNKKNWTTIDSTYNKYRGVKFINGRFVVFGALVTSSVTGLSWTPPVSVPNVSDITAGAGIYDVSYGNGMYVFAGYYYVYNSTDLTDIILRATYNQVIFYQVEYWNGCFFIGTHNSSGNYSTRPLFSADNGVTWNNMSISRNGGTSFLPARDVFIVSESDSTNLFTKLHIFNSVAFASTATKIITINTLYNVCRMAYKYGQILIPGSIKVGSVATIYTGCFDLATEKVSLNVGGVNMSNGFDFIDEDCEFIACGQSGYMAGAQYKYKVPDLRTEETTSYIKLAE